MANSRADHYRKQAEECRAQAEKSQYEGQKSAWLKLATKWPWMAEEVEAANGRAALRNNSKQ